MSRTLRPGIQRVRHLGGVVACAVMLIVLLLPASVLAATRVAILIPQTPSKAQAIYEEIYSGVMLAANAELIRFNVSADTTAEQVKQWLHEHKPSAVITISKTPYEYASSSGLNVPLIVGGLGSTPNGVSGVSLAGDPAEFFANAKQIAPTVERVYLVYNESMNGWWLDDAHKSAEQNGLELVALEAASVRKGAKIYKKMLKDARKDKDAVWIPLVTVVPSKTVLPMVLRKAWDKHLVVFTNSPIHAKQGALFSLYPDNAAMGAQLMELALERAEADNTEPRVVMARNMKRAFNWRTASHLGLKYTLDEEAGFDRIYPVQ
ncbi:MAG: ABC transporter substrate-binding protein [Pseudomonadales bacterium]